LPAELSGFVGRARESAEVAGLLGSTRLLTLVGPGGAGKTRLAVHVAAATLDQYVEGAWLVELGSLVDPELVPQAAAQALGVREQAGRSVLEALQDAVGARTRLLVLDNCEHLIDACARLADDLLRACPGLRLLATSREPLGVAGEVIWRVPPLGLGESGPDLERADAVRLFVERARASLPEFALTDDNRVSVARICRRLDGLPLAIELAAARVRVLSPSEIAARLDDRFTLLVGGSRTAPRRQQTLAAAVEWSFALLSPAEQRLFQRLAVFADGFSLAAVEAVAADESADVLDGLWRLVDRSLVVVEPSAAGLETRYRLLETLRAYAWERLVASGQAEVCLRRLADWLVRTAEEAGAAFHGPEQGGWLRWAEAEHGNVRAVLHWLISHQQTEAALRLVAGLWWSWVQRGRWHEGQSWFTQCLALPGAEARTRTRARVLGAAGAVAILGYGQPRVGRECLEESLAIGLEVDDPVAIINARSMLTGLVGLREGADLDQIQASSAELLAYTRRVRDRWGENRALITLAEVAHQREDFASARRTLEEAVRVAREAGDGWSLGMTLVNLGDLERSDGQHRRAGELYEESLATFAQIGLARHPLEHPYLLHNLGYVALAAGQPDLAFERFMDALLGNQRAGDRRGVAECLIGLGAAAAARDQPERAVHLFAAGEAALSAAHGELWHANRRDYTHWREVASRALGQAAFERAWSAGARLSVDEALAGTGPRRSPASRPSLSGLTPREADVARLVASGLTNRQIGEALVITEKTAANHVQRVLDKLGVHSRTQLAARSADFGLEPAVRHG
jgi:non-specific serine/threonine protein kinase